MPTEFLAAVSSAAMASSRDSVSAWSSPDEAKLYMVPSDLRNNKGAREPFVGEIVVGLLVPLL